MTDNDAGKKPEKAHMKKSEMKLIIAVAAIFVVLVGALIFATPAPKKPEPSPAQTAAATPAPFAVPPQPAAAPPPPASAFPAPPPATVPVIASPAAPAQPAPVNAAAATPPANPAINIDVNAALSDRIIGDISAPLKVSEHASLTCPHCAEFDKNTFPDFKKNFIDTKKAYLVFSDFPLNKPAMDAAMIARCLPQAKYFDFIHMLFATQDQWAYAPSYMDYLKSRAAENGFDAAHVDACLASKDLQDGMIGRMKAVSAQWHVNSTPSFVINNKTVISGAYPYDQFSKVLNDEFSKLPGNSAAAPAAPSFPMPTNDDQPAPSAGAPSPAAPAAPAPSDNGGATGAH